MLSKGLSSSARDSFAADDRRVDHRDTEITEKTFPAKGREKLEQCGVCPRPVATIHHESDQGEQQVRRLKRLSTFEEN